MQTNNLKEALLRADKTYRTVDGETRKLHCGEDNGVFHCNAEIMDPKTDEDRKFCLMDLWRSESDKAARFLAAFAKLGGFEAAKPVNPNAGVVQAFPNGRWTPPPFNEADCGGAFDGFTVTSDADPGL